MPANTKLNLEGFAAIVRQSGLIDAEVLKRALKDIREQTPDLDDPRPLCNLLVSQNLVTAWQADKLLQGKHRGFFLGKYRLLSHLGSGGMSSVYLAEHVLMRRRVAIKVLPKSRLNDSSYLERFHREARAVASLDHRNIVRAYDVDQEDKNHFLVMEYVPGVSLHELVIVKGPLDVVRAVEYTRQAAEGLHHAHRMGMVHRDIKPGNLLLDDKGTIKLLDLGLARFYDESEEDSLTRKHDEKILGTADYLSPEQALDSHLADVRSDIYSLGCTLYFFLCGHPPFPDGTLAQRLLAHQTREPSPISRERPDVPDSLAAILNRMMAKLPRQRYQSAQEVAQVLRQWLHENGGAMWAAISPGAADSVAPTNGSATGAAQPPSSSNVLSAAEPSVARGAPTAATSSAPTTARAAEPELAAFLSKLAAQESDALSTAETSKVPVLAPGKVAAPPQSPRKSSSSNRAVLLTPADGAESSAAATSPTRATGQSLHERTAREGEPSSYATRDKRRPAESRRQALLIGAGIAVAVLSSLLVFLLLRDSTPATTAKTGTAANSAPPIETQRGVPAPRRGGTIRRDFVVGPTAEFKSITAALNELKQQTGGKGRAPATIRIAAGQTYPERIQLDGSWPSGIRILAEAGPPPVLAPPGSEPVIVLGSSKDELNDFRIEGLHIDAAGKPVAVRLTGWVPGVRLTHLKITGFSQAGILLDGTQTYGAEDARILLENLSFGDASDQANGIELAGTTEAPAHVRIKSCRFQSPLSAGVRVGGDALDVEIEESIFYRTQAGIRLGGTSRLWRDLTFDFNTFFETGLGIAFDDMPSDKSNGLGYYNNLFVHTTVADAVVEKNYDAKQFLATYRTNPRGAGYNWTTRAHLDPPDNGALALLFDIEHGRYDASVQFQSTDPASPNFLAPAPSSAHRQAGTLLDKKRYGTQVGAVR